MIRVLFKAAFGVYALLLVAVICLADAGQGHRFWPFVDRIPAGDKLGHFVMFGLLAFLANAAMNGARVRLGTVQLLKGSLVVLVPTVLEEFSQLFLRYRTFDLLDLTADAVGILLGGWLALLLLRPLNLWERARMISAESKQAG